MRSSTTACSRRGSRACPTRGSRRAAPAGASPSGRPTVRTSARSTHGRSGASWATVPCTRRGRGASRPRSPACCRSAARPAERPSREPARIGAKPTKRAQGTGDVPPIPAVQSPREDASTRMEDRGGAGGGVRDRRRIATRRPWPWLRAPRPRQDESGFTLIELVIAVSIFAIMTAGIVATINSGLTLSRNNRNRSVAANLAAEQMDNLRSMDFATLQAQLGTHSAQKSVGDSPPYTVQTVVTPVPINSSSAPCDANGGATNNLVFRVNVTVTWPDLLGVTHGDPVKTGAATANTIIS